MSELEEVGFESLEALKEVSANVKDSPRHKMDSQYVCVVVWLQKHVIATDVRQITGLVLARF